MRYCDGPVQAGELRVFRTLSGERLSRDMRYAVYCSAFGVNHIRAKGGRVYGVRESWELVQRVLERPCEVGVRYAHQWRVGDFVIWGARPPALSPLALC